MGNRPVTIGLKVDPPPSTSPLSTTAKPDSETSHLQSSSSSYYRAGSTVTGRVYLSVTKNNAISARSIQLKLIGKEDLVIHYTEEVDDDDGNDYDDRGGGGGGGRGRSPSTHREDRYDRSTNTIINLDHPLHIFDDDDSTTTTLRQGQYEFPFELELPDYLPSSFSSVTKGQSSCEVSYEIVAELYQQRPSSMFHTNPTSTQRIHVAAITSTTRQHDTSLHLPSEEFFIRTCCCCRYQGYVSMECSVNATTIRPPRHHHQRNGNDNRNDGDDKDDKLWVSWKAQNHSTARIQSITAKLVQTVEWTATATRRTESLSSVLSQTTINAQQFQELDKLTRKQVRRQRRRYERLRRRDQQQQQRRQVLDTSAEDGVGLLGGAADTSNVVDDDGWHDIGPLTINSPSSYHVLDTYDGYGIQVRHMLLLTLETDGCCTTTPELSTLIYIYKSLEDGYNEQVSPSAPPPSAPLMGENESYQPYPTTLHDCPPPSAPPMMMLQDDTDMTAGYQNTSNVAPYYSTTETNTSFYDNGVATVAVATEVTAVLPDDWNPQTANVVHIPFAQAIPVNDNDDDVNAGVKSQQSQS